jgi:hypothetical protein
LSAYIASLRSELERAVLAAPAKGVRLTVGKIELEVTTEVSGTVEGGLTFKVLSGKASKSTSNTQVLRLELTATRSDAEGQSRPVEVNDVDDG